MVKLSKMKKAFTLIEMLIVIIIIGILMSALLPRLKAAQNSAKLTTLQQNAKNLSTPLLQFNLKSISVDDGYKAGSDEIQKAGGILLFRKTSDDSAVLGNYLVNITGPSGDDLKTILTKSYQFSPNEFTVGDNPSISSLIDNGYYTLVDYNANDDIVTGQLFLYCTKSTDFHGMDDYEKAWSRVANAIGKLG